MKVRGIISLVAAFCIANAAEKREEDTLLRALDNLSSRQTATCKKIFKKSLLDKKTKKILCDAKTCGKINKDFLNVHKTSCFKVPYFNFINSDHIVLKDIDRLDISHEPLWYFKLDYEKDFYYQPSCSGSQPCDFVFDAQCNGEEWIHIWLHDIEGLSKMDIVLLRMVSGLQGLIEYNSYLDTDIIETAALFLRAKINNCSQAVKKDAVSEAIDHIRITAELSRKRLSASSTTTEGCTIL